MTSALLSRAASAGLSLALDGEDLVIEGPQNAEAEAVALALLAEEQRVTLALRVLEMASRNWGNAVITGGRWADGGRWYEPGHHNGANSRKLLLGVVVGGSEDRWRAFCDRASMKQLIEAEAILQSLASAA
ncbi:MAG TPA: hypothetical protein VH393_03775 [Ktedonobacterales bacterium]|jgi:hypothetical protein